MNVTEAILNRRSIRGYQPKPVPRKVLEEILDACRWAPSAQNTQTWELAIVGGEAKTRLTAALEEKVKAGAKPNPDYPNLELPEPYAQRAVDARESVDRHQFPPGTQDLDRKRAEYLWKGSRLFDSPAAIFVFTDKVFDFKSLINAGLLAQSIALAAFERGLGTCIMTRAGHYPDVVRGILGVPPSKNLILGIAIGYPDPDAKPNTYPRHRLKVADFTKWLGF